MKQATPSTKKFLTASFQTMVAGVVWTALLVGITLLAWKTQAPSYTATQTRLDAASSVQQIPVRTASVFETPAFFADHDDDDDGGTCGPGTDDDDDDGMGDDDDGNSDNDDDDDGTFCGCVPGGGDDDDDDDDGDTSADGASGHTSGNTGGSGDDDDDGNTGGSGDDDDDGMGDDDDGSPDYVGPFVPIMPSVMSYTFQLRGVRTRMLDLGLTFDEALFKEIDFSHGRLCSLDENNLNEVRGTTMISTDWDCDGMLEANVVKDINESGNWCDTDGNLTNSIRDYDEWANIEDGAALAASGAPADQAKLEQRRQMMRKMRPCISFKEWQQVQQEFQLRGGGPALTVESCISGENVYIGDSVFFEAGTCSLPFDSIQVAHDFSPSNSVFYVVPNTYDEAGNVLLDKPGKYFCKTGSAIFE